MKKNSKKVTTSSSKKNSVSLIRSLIYRIGLYFIAVGLLYLASLETLPPILPIIVSYVPSILLIWLVALEFKPFITAKKRKRALIIYLVACIVSLIFVVPNMFFLAGGIISYLVLIVAKLKTT